MDKITDVNNTEAQARVTEALKFFESPLKRAWQDQRIKNDKDDLRNSLPDGIKLLNNGYANELTKILCSE